MVASLALLFMHSASAFTVQSVARAKSSLSMAPRFDKASEKWFATKPSEEKEAGYGPLGSLIRCGPKPFFNHLLFFEQYDQAVLKYMATDGCSRNEAQANMDFYVENPNGKSTFL